jgi:hypothetical protein
LSLGVSGDGGLPLRMGLHDGNASDTVDVLQAIEQSLGACAKMTYPYVGCTTTSHFGNVFERCQNSFSSFKTV